MRGACRTRACCQSEIMTPERTPIPSGNLWERPRPALTAGSTDRRGASAWKLGWFAVLGCFAVVVALVVIPTIGRALIGGAAAQDWAKDDPKWSPMVEVDSSRLLGRAVEPDMSTPMPGLPVVLRNEETGQVTRGTTDADGRFNLSWREPGPGILQVGSPGIQARLRVVHGAHEGELLVVLSRMSSVPVPPGVPAELAPEPVPAVASRRGGKLVLAAAPLWAAPPSARDDGSVTLCRWSPAWIGRTVP